MNRLQSLTSTTLRISFVLICLVVFANLAGCNRREEAAPGGFAVVDFPDCLPPLALLDQHGRNVSLADLKGKPILFDFIYTSCPGECLTLTMRMKRIAAALGPQLGKNVRLVSITVDPEHDQPKELLKYASDQGAEMNGWLFLTGTPRQIDDVLRQFKLFRQRHPDGSVDHVLEMFLVAPDGRPLLQYLGDKINTDRAAADLDAVAAGKAVTASEGTVQAVKD